MSSSTRGVTKLQDQGLPPPPTLNQKESEYWCPICLKRLQGGVKSVIQCVQCKNGVHYECGLPLFKDIKKNTSNWICDMCKAKKNTTPKGKRAIEDRRCIICRESTTKDYGLYKECENIISRYKGQQFVHLRCQRWHPEIKVSSDCMLYSTNKFKGMGVNSIDEEEVCFVCSKVSEEMLCMCMVKDCKSDNRFFHPTCLASQIPLSEYTLVLYKRCIENKLGIFKKLGILCSDHKNLSKDELQKRFPSDIEEFQKQPNYSSKKKADTDSVTPSDLSQSSIPTPKQKINLDKEVQKKLQRYYGDICACEVCGIDILSQNFMYNTVYCVVCMTLMHKECNDKNNIINTLDSKCNSSTCKSDGQVSRRSKDQTAHPQVYSSCHICKKSFKGQTNVLFCEEQSAHYVCILFYKDDESLTDESPTTPVLSKCYICGDREGQMVHCQACTDQRGKITSCHASCIMLIKKDKADGRRFKYFLREDGQMMCKEHKRSEYSRANSAQRVAFKERISDISDDIQQKKKQESANNKKEQDSNKKRTSKEERSQTKIDAYITPQKRESSYKTSQLELAVRADSIEVLQNELEKIANQEYLSDAINHPNELTKQIQEQQSIDVPNENPALQEKKEQPDVKIPKENKKQLSPILCQATPMQNFDIQSQRGMVNILKKPTLEETVAIEKKFDIVSQSQKKLTPDILDFNKSLTEMINNHSSEIQGRYTHKIAPNHHKKSDLQIKGVSRQNQHPNFAVPKFPPMVIPQQQLDGLSSALIQPVNPYPIKPNSHILDYNPSRLVPLLQPYKSVQQTTVFPQKTSDPTKKKRDEKQKVKQEPKSDIQKSDKQSTKQQTNQGEVKSRSKSAIWKQISRNNRSIGGKFNRAQNFAQNHFKKPRSGTKSLKGPVQRHMNISSRDEQKLSNLTIDWDLFRTHFKIIDKADTDRLSYSLVPKKVNVQKDCVFKLKEQEQNMDLAQNHQKLELEQWFQQAQKQSQDSLLDQTITCTVLLMNTILEKNVLIQYKQRPIDTSIQYLCPNSQLKGSLLSSSSVFTHSLSSTMEGSLSSCLINNFQVPSFPPMPFPQSPTKAQQLKVHEFYSIERETPLTLKLQDFYVSQIIQLPPNANHFISDLLQKNDAITEALKLASDSQLTNSDQLTLTILSNSIFKNMIIDDIEKEKCEILKQITRQKRQMEQDYNELIKDIGEKHGLILFNQKLGKFKGDSDSDSESGIDLDLNLSDGEESLMFDESCILQSMKYKQRSSQRTKQMWAWQAIVQTFMPSFQPTTQQQIILQYDQCESPYTCMCCYLSYYDNLNPIVYCDYCDSGVHQRCYGIEDLDEPFFCDKCQMRRKRHDIDTPQKTVIQTTPSGVQSKTQNLCCIICNKPEGFMKIDTTYTKGQQTFFHVFCIFTSTFAFFKNISTLKQIDFDLALGKDSLGSSLCKYCQKLEEDKDCVLETCITCKSSKFHSMCAWLEGCQFTLKRIPLSDTKENSVRFQKQFYKMSYDFATEVTCLGCLEAHSPQVFQKCGELSKARMFKWIQVEINVAALKERKRRELTTVKEEDSVKSESQKQKVEVKSKKNKKDKKKKKRKAKDANEHIMGTLSTGETSF